MVKKSLLVARPNRASIEKTTLVKKSYKKVYLDYKVVTIASYR